MKNLKRIQMHLLIYTAVIVMMFMVLFSGSVICTPASAQARAQKERPQPTAEDLEEMKVSLDASKTVEESTKLADLMLSEPESLNIPWYVLDNAAGVIIIPGMVRAGFIAGGSFGSGTLFTREGNKWSPPIFVYLSGASIGLQVGITRSDLILVINEPRTLKNLYKDKSFRLGLDATIALGPLSGSIGGSAIKEGIYVYEKSRGLFAGLSFTGGSLTLDREMTSAYYIQGEDESVRGYYEEERNRLVGDLTETKKKEKQVQIPRSARNLQKKLDELVANGRP